MAGLDFRDGLDRPLRAALMAARAGRRTDATSTLTAATIPLVRVVGAPEKKSAKARVEPTPLGRLFVGDDPARPFGAPLPYALISGLGTLPPLDAAGVVAALLGSAAPADVSWTQRGDEEPMSRAALTAVLTSGAGDVVLRPRWSIETRETGTRLLVEAPPSWLHVDDFLAAVKAARLRCRAERRADGFVVAWSRADEGAVKERLLRPHLCARRTFGLDLAVDGTIQRQPLARWLDEWRAWASARLASDGTPSSAYVEALVRLRLVQTPGLLAAVLRSHKHDAAAEMSRRLALTPTEAAIAARTGLPLLAAQYGEDATDLRRAVDEARAASTVTIESTLADGLTAAQSRE